MKTLEKINQTFKSLVEKERIRILTNYSQKFCEFILELEIIDLNWEDEDSKYYDHYIEVRYKGETCTFLDNEEEIIYYIGSEKMDFIEEFSTNEMLYLEETLRELELGDEVGTVREEKSIEKAEKLTKVLSKATLEQITYEDGEYKIKFSDGKSINVESIDAREIL